MKRAAAPVHRLRPTPWRRQLIDTEPAYEAYRMKHGQLASAGIEKGKPFAPDTRMKAILEKAAQMANDARTALRPDRVVWPDRQWEWASLRRRMGPSTSPLTRTWKRGKDGLTKPRANPPRCSAAMPKQDRSTVDLYFGQTAPAGKESQ
jgi:hypothetical protein